MKVWIGLLILLVLVAACKGATGNVVAEAPANLRAAPDFNVEAISGEQISLAENTAAGKPTVVYFMASWCSKCAKNWKALNEVYPKYEDRVDFVAISIDPTDSEATLTKLAAEKGFVFDAVRGGTGVPEAFGVKAQTAKFAIDGKGNIVDRHDGVLSATEWETFFAQLV